jgi:outer membrane protein assembly factor BamD
MWPGILADAGPRLYRPPAPDPVSIYFRPFKPDPTPASPSPMTAAQTVARKTCQILPALALLLAGMSLSGCKSWGGDEKEVYGSPDQMYSDAADSLRAGNYEGAAQKLELLESRYPFSNAAKQGQLDLMYAYYKNYDLESAVDQADQFIRENPTHPRVDYAYYLRGLVYFESGANWLERLFRADVTQRPPG